VWDATTGGNQIQSVASEQSGGAPTNRIASVTSGGATVNYSYDAAGNVTNDGVHGYTYDAENRLVSVDGGGTGQYSYDQQNRRYKKVVGSAVTDYVWEGSRVLAEHDGSTGGVITDYVYRGKRMVAKVEGGVTSYFLRDRLSVRLMVDASGNVIGRQGHLPYGEDFAEIGSQEKHQFTGYERDGESGLDYALNRGYGSSLGRFQQSDAYQPGTSLGSQGWNRYAYAEGDPINFVDPAGTFRLPFLPGWPGDWGGGPLGFGDGFEGTPPPMRPGGPPPLSNDNSRGGAGGSKDPPINFSVSRSADMIMQAVDLVTKNYAACAEATFGGDSDFGGQAIPSAAAAIDSLASGFLKPEIAAMVGAIWAIESNWDLFPKGDHGPAQLTKYWQRRKPELILPGAYDPFSRRQGSPNRDLAFTGDPQANLFTLGNIVRWTHALYGNWSAVAYWYGPGDAGAISRPDYQAAATVLFDKYKGFFECIKQGPEQ
jgi:RHS repeat-associated protein